VQDIDADYVEDLQHRLRNTDLKVAALQKAITDLENSDAGGARDARLVAEVREQLAQANSRVESYISMFGDIASTPADAKAKEAELQRLRLQVEQNAQASAALETELDKLSAAWESLDRQVKNKVFDLVALEERVSKVTHEKAKFENKFYSAMRDKEASETERKNIARSLEKSTKAYENVTALERNLKTQVAGLEKEIGILNTIKDKQASRITSLEADVKRQELHVAYERTRVEQSSKLLQDGQRSLDKRKSEVRRLEEDVARLRKEAERQAQKARTTASVAAPTPGSSRELDLQNEVDKCMSILKCSTCRMRMRNTVITKCMHSFCKDCVDARIATRQRKCPACNLPFAQSEVSQLYFQ
jgi:E3 ubiquitin-protein ligase BRE1